MWALAGSIVLAIVAMATTAVMPPMSVETIGEAVVSNQESIAQLSKAVATMVEADGEVKERLTEATRVLIDSQNALQKHLNGPKQPGARRSKGQGEQDDDVLRQFANQVATSLRELTLRDSGGNSNKSYSEMSKSSTNGTVLIEILSELRNLNTHFQRHFMSLSCPPPFVMLGSECFNVIQEDLSWADARNKCISIGADLAQPEHIQELKIFVGKRYPRKNRRNFWIGGVYQEKIWQWLSGDVLEEGFWHTNEPSGNGQCLAMFDGWEYPFTDFPCENERRAICKRLFV